jgi:biopolymer transport protein ExbD
LNIFFLVTTLVTALAEVDLPAAKHVVGTDLESSVVFTVLSNGMDGSIVYSGDGTDGDPLPDEGQLEMIAAAAEQGLQSGKKSVVIKAERDVPMREIARISAAANLNEDIEFFVAVMEMEQGTGIHD